MHDPRSSSCEGASTSSHRHSTVKVTRERRLQPLLGDALDPPTGEVQGLAWFFAAFHRDEWGNVANELLEAVQGQLQRVRQKHLRSSAVAYDRPPNPFGVRRTLREREGVAS